MDKWVFCGLCVFMLVIIMCSSYSSCSLCGSRKESMSNMDDEYIFMTVTEMQESEEDFDLEQYVREYLKLRKETIKNMALRLEDTQFFDILEDKTGLSDIKTITELKDDLDRIHDSIE